MQSHIRILLFVSVLVCASAVAGQPERYLLHVDPADIDNVLQELEARDDIADIKLLFGEQILVTTERPEALTATRNTFKMYQDSVISPRSIGFVGTVDSNDNIEPQRTLTKGQQKIQAPTLDPMSGFQWAYENYGYARGVAGVDTGIHAISETGVGSIIAIASTGVDHTHEDLQNALWVNSGEIAANGLDDDGNGFVDDYYGPGPLGSGDTLDVVGTGTALAGIIAASRDNGLGITGLAPDAKVLACNSALPTGQLSTVDIVLCINYVIEQKIRYGQNIRVFIAGFRSFSPFNQVIEPAMRALHEADILVIAPTYMVPSGYAGQNLDVSTDSPSTMRYSNILAVSAVDRAGITAFRTNGRHTIDTSLPGVDILTTLIGYLGVVDGTGFLSEDFEASPSGWAFSGGWQYSASGGQGDSGALQLNIGAGDIFSDDQTVELPALDVSGIPGGVPYFSFDLRGENLVNAGTPQYVAGMYLEWYSETQDAWWEIVSNYELREGPAWQSILGYLTDYQLAQVDPANLKLRFRARATSDHVPSFTIDNLRIGPPPTDPGYSNNYGDFSGTGASAAVAASMASILLERNPSLTTGELRNLLMNSGQTLQAILNQPDVEGIDISLTNRMAQLWNADGTGAIQCAGTTTGGRTHPAWIRGQTQNLGLGQKTLFEAVSSVCESSGTAPVITEQMGGRSLTMLDDGTGLDQVADDGLFAAEWSSDTPVNDILEFSNDESVNVLSLAHYEAEEVTFQWRTKANGPEFYPYRTFEPPFELLIGGLDTGSGFESDVALGTHPGVSTDGFSTWGPTGFMRPGSPATIRNEPTVGPRVGVFQVIPFWTQAYVQGSIDSSSDPQPEVQGTAPNREWVIEWRQYTYGNCPERSNSFQVVLFENSPDVLLNFKDVADDCNGVAPQVMLTHNFDSWHLFDIELRPTMSILLSPKFGALNSAPEQVADIPAQMIVHGEEFTLDIAPYFDDSDGDSLEFYLGRDSEFVSVSRDGILSARFPYNRQTELPLSTIEVVAHDGYLSKRATFEVVLDNSNNQPPQQVAALPVFEGVEGELLRFNLLQYFEDPDGDPLQVIELDASEGMLRVYDGKTLIITGTTGESSSSREFLVVDGEYALQFTVSGSIVDIPETAPELIEPIPVQTVRVGETLRVPLYKYFRTDPWGRISYLMNDVEGDSAFDSRATWVAVFDEEDQDNGPLDIVVRALRSGTNLETTTTIRVNIYPANRAPRLVSDDPISVTRNQAVDLRLDNLFVDQDGDEMFFVVLSLPPGLQEASAGRITGAISAVGQYEARVRVIDVLGKGQITTVSISVTDPVVVPPPPPSSGGGGGGGGGGAMTPFGLALFGLLAIGRMRRKRRLSWTARRV